jgi:hypothetical protein
MLEDISTIKLFSRSKEKKMQFIVIGFFCLLDESKPLQTCNFHPLDALLGLDELEVDLVLILKELLCFHFPLIFG